MQGNPSVSSNQVTALESDSEQSCTPPEVADMAKEATACLLPDKSSGAYNKTYAAFLSWCRDNQMPTGRYTENVILAYISSLSSRYAASTLWSKFSMLRKTILALGAHDVGRLPKVEAFLKKLNKKHVVKKSCSFTREHIERFLKEASDEEHLHIKLVILFGLFGACRKSELASMMLGHVTDFGAHLKVCIPESKTGSRSFLLVGANDERLDVLKYFHKYISVRPKDAPPRLFLGYRGGKCIRAPIGKNTLATFPMKVAEFLGLPCATGYSGHALRRTAATWMADSGVDLINLKRFGGWQSDTVAQSYVAESTSNKINLAEALIGKVNMNTSASVGDQNMVTMATSEPNLNLASCSNFTININISK